MQPELLNELKEEGYTDIREVEGKGICGLVNMIFTTGLCYGVDKVSYSYAGRFCFHTYDEAKTALHNWDGKDSPSGIG